MDNLDPLELYGLARDADANREQQAQTNELKAIRREIRRSREERDRESSLPQCPVCGGRLEGQFKKCKHCTSDLVWVEDIPCEPSEAEELRKRLADKRRHESEAEERRIEEREMNRRPCVTCGAKTYADQLTRKKCCQKCAAHWRELVWNLQVLFGVVGLIVGALVGYLIYSELGLANGGDNAEMLVAEIVLVLIFAGAAGFLGLLGGFFLGAIVAAPMSPE